MSKLIFYPQIYDIWFYLLVIAILEGIAIYTWQYRKVPGARPQVFCQICKAFWLLSLVFISVSTQMPYKIFWCGLEHIASTLLTYTWLMLVLEISEQKKKFPAKLLRAIQGCLIFLVLALVSNSWHGLFWSQVVVQNQALSVLRGPFSYLNLAFCYLIILLNVILSVRWVLRTAGLRRWQALAITITPLFSVVGHFLALILKPLGISPIPVGFLLTGVFLTGAFYWWRIYSIMPLARAAAYENMVDGLLVIDEQDYIVEINSTAQKIFGDVTPVFIGSKFHDVIKAWPALAKTDTNLFLHGMEVDLQYRGIHAFYRLQLIPLQDKQGHLLGKIVVLQDINQQKRDQAKLVEQEKTLSILKERERLGRELHDGRAQIWSYFQIELQSVRNLLAQAQTEAADTQIDRLLDIVKDLNTDVRESIAALKNKTSTQLDFIVALREYLEWYEKNYGIVTHLRLPAAPVDYLFQSTGKVQLLRIIQEALTNVRKHAQAHHVDVIFQNWG